MLKVTVILLFIKYLCDDGRLFPSTFRPSLNKIEFWQQCQWLAHRETVKQKKKSGALDPFMIARRLDDAGTICRMACTRALAIWNLSKPFSSL
jgi:hypothetical protein